MRLFRYLLRKYFVAWAYLLATNMPFVHAENDFHAVENLVQTACISCHDAETDTHLNLNAIDKPDGFHQWVEKCHHQTLSYQAMKRGMPHYRHLKKNFQK